MQMKFVHSFRCLSWNWVKSSFRACWESKVLKRAPTYKDLIMKENVLEKDTTEIDEGLSGVLMFKLISRGHAEPSQKKEKNNCLHNIHQQQKSVFFCVVVLCQVIITLKDNQLYTLVVVSSHYAVKSL